MNKPWHTLDKPSAMVRPWNAAALAEEIIPRFLLLFLLALGSQVAIAQARIAPLSDAVDGATCTHFNLGGQLHWSNKPLDWIDAAGARQGTVPFDKQILRTKDPAPDAQWQVTAAVQSAIASGAKTIGLVLLPLPDAGRGVQVAALHSREAQNTSDRPTLVLEYKDGYSELVAATADTYTDCSSNRGLGKAPFIKIGEGRAALLEFPLSRVRNAPIANATLRLARATRYGDVAVGAFLLESPRFAEGPMRQDGIASRYPGDRGIASDPDVYMATSFEQTDWKSQWTGFATYGQREAFSVVGADPSLKFEPISGPALRVHIPTGQHLGLDMRFDFAKKRFPEPDEAYFRYYLRLSDDWYPVDSGKLPGFAGTYGQAGWGDRPADASKGWAARGGFSPAPTPENTLRAFQAVGSYTAHPDPGGAEGETWPWPMGLGGLLQRNRWHCIEQRIRMNTPGARDGVLQVWVDGRLAMSRENLRFRDVPTLRIESVWMNVYYGGRMPAPKDLHLYIDDVVIARRYIGPRTGT